MVLPGNYATMNTPDSRLTPRPNRSLTPVVKYRFANNATGAVQYRR